MPRFLMLIFLFFLFSEVGTSTPVSNFRKENKKNDRSLYAMIEIGQQRPIANAGQDTTLYYPVNILDLDGSRSFSNDGILYAWRKISGPGSYFIKNPTRAVTEVRSLVPGIYLFELTVTDYGHRSARDTVTVKVLADSTKPGDVPFTANTQVPAYTVPFQYGTNPSTYGNGWGDTSIASIALKAGVHSIRLPLPDNFVEHYGYDVRLNAFNYYIHQLGMKELTLFVGKPGDADRDRTVYPGNTKISSVFTNLYEPIWDKGENGTPVNENNNFARYIYKLVKWYGKDIKFWEIVNEPDATGFWDNANKNRSDNWWDNPPQPGALLNLRAPFFYYIRMLRIAYEVIKKYYPDSYVAPGGIGFPAFLDALLRYTDNPDGGKVTSKYPLTGGAYFDVVSYHIYPAYSFQEWDNSIGGFRWSRHSDRAAEALIDLKDQFNEVLVNHGYNGGQYPRKLFIMTETNLSRKPFGTYWGNNEIQRNFIIKSLVKAQQDNIKQFYTYQIGETAGYNTAKIPYDLMGLYENLKRDPYGSEKLTDEGKAFKTTSMLLYGWKYDAKRTQILNLPEAIDGAAFKKGNEYRYVLWAKTHTDKSEKAKATYSFPTSLGIDSLTRYEWNYSVKPGVARHISSQYISLTGAPFFFSEITGQTTPHLLEADAGKDQVVTLPTEAITLNGLKSKAPYGTIVSYLWTNISGPDNVAIQEPKSAQTKVLNLAAGVYVFKLTIRDDQGISASDQVSVTVHPAINQGPTAKAGKDKIITLPQNETTLDGSGSSDPDGKLISYLWKQTSGPTTATVNTRNEAKTKVSNLVAGLYVFTLLVKDDNGASDTDKINIQVNETTATRAMANAGIDRIITLPKDTLILDGTATTGTVTSWYWSKEKGPVGGTIKQMGARAVVSNLHPGTYQFYLTVSGPVGWPNSDRIIITVKRKDDKKEPENQRAIANAGADRTIFLPKDTLVLDGSASTGNITSWYWSKEKGPDGGHILRKDEKAVISDLHPGTYNFYLTVSGPVGWPNSDRVVITVKENNEKEGDYSKPENQQAIANAGADRTIILPKDTLVLDGSASTGNITSWYWSKEKGPEGGHILRKGEKAVISDLHPGTYNFYLTVSGPVGWPNSDRVVITAKEGNLYKRKIRNTSTDTTNPNKLGRIVNGEKASIVINGDRIKQKINPKETFKFTVYPNPVHNQINIKLDRINNKQTICRIIDIHGKIVKMYYLGRIRRTYTQSIDLGNLSNGIYFIQIMEGEEMKGVQKIVKF